MKKKIVIIKKYNLIEIILEKQFNNIKKWPQNCWPLFIK